MVACRYKSGTLSYSGTSTSRRVARETCQLITVLLRGGWADQFGASRYATPLSVDSVAAIITATQPPRCAFASTRQFRESLVTVFTLETR